MTKSYDEQDGFRKKAGERDFKIRRVGPARPEPTAAPVHESGWTLLDQVAGNATDEAAPAPAPAAAESAPAAARAMVTPSGPRPAAEAARPRFRSLLAGQSDAAPEPVSGAYNGTPLKPLLRRIAERQAMKRPSGFDAWR